MKNNTIDAKLLSAQVAIENALGNETIKQAVALYGYTETKLLAGKSLLDEAQNKQANQKKEYGEQYKASDELDSAITEANRLYIRHVKIARIALSGMRGAAESLQLGGRRKQSYSGWIKQTNIFYANALSDTTIKAKLAEFGIDESALQEGQAKVKEVEAKLAAQLKEKGEAQESTQQRDEAFEALLDWTSDFVAIARIALENDPQLLEILGIVEPS
jgi:vacuolar-type H+-ATPase subunit I/STV1